MANQKMNERFSGQANERANHAEVLGVGPDAELPAIKAAYRAKLKDFPAHSHPQEFKAVRAAYEALRKPVAQQLEKDFFKPKPLKVELDSEQIKALRERMLDQVDKSLEELLKLSF